MGAQSLKGFLLLSSIQNTAPSLRTTVGSSLCRCTKSTLQRFLADSFCVPNCSYVSRRLHVSFKIQLPFRVRINISLPFCRSVLHAMSMSKAMKGAVLIIISPLSFSSCCCLPMKQHRSLIGRNARTPNRLSTQLLAPGEQRERERKLPARRKNS